MAAQNNTLVSGFLYGLNSQEGTAIYVNPYKEAEKFFFEPSVVIHEDGGHLSHMSNSASAKLATASIFVADVSHSYGCALQILSEIKCSKTGFGNLQEIKSCDPRLLATLII